MISKNHNYLDDFDLDISFRERRMLLADLSIETGVALDPEIHIGSGSTRDDYGKAIDAYVGCAEAFDPNSAS